MGTYISSEQWDSTVRSINMEKYDHYDSTGRHYFDQVDDCKIEY